MIRSDIQKYFHSFLIQRMFDLFSLPILFPFIFFCNFFAENFAKFRILSIFALAKANARSTGEVGEWLKPTVC